MEKEKEWGLKSKALWLQARDENTKLFPGYANDRNNINFVWKINKGDGTLATNFKDMAFKGVKHISSLVKEDMCAIIVVVIMPSNSFPSFVNEEDNHALIKEVGKELYQTLQIFQKEISHGPNGLPVEFILDCYDFIKEDL